MNTETDETSSTFSVIHRFVRVELLSTILVILLLALAYLYLFVDYHLEWAVESMGSRAIGAQMDVGSLETEWGSLKVDITGLGITNPRNPSRNLIEAEQFSLKLSIPALARSKVQVDNLNIEGVRLNTRRETPGWVSEDGGDIQWLLESGRRLFEARLEESTRSNIFGDVLDLLSGVSIEEILSKYRDQLQTDDRVNSLQRDLEEFQKNLTRQREELPSRSEIEELKSKVQELINTEQEGGDILSQVNQVQRLKELRDKTSDWKNRFEDSLKQLRADVDSFSSDLSDLPNTVKSDVNVLRSRLSLPDFSFEDPSSTIFHQFLENRAGSLNTILTRLEPYLEKGRKRISGSIGDDRYKIGGVDYRFPMEESRPDYWIREFRFSGSDDESFPFQLSLAMDNISSNPMIMEAPMNLSFELRLPDQMIKEFEGNLSIQNFGDQVKADYDFMARDITISEWQFINSPEFGLTILDGLGKFQINGTYSPSQVQTAVDLSVDQPKFKLFGDNKVAREILNGIIGDLEEIHLSANGTGEFPQMKWDVNSNIGSEIQAGTKRYLSNKMESMKKDLAENYRERMSAQITEARNKLETLRNQGLDELSTRLEAVVSIQSVIEEQLKNGNGSVKQLQDLF